MDAAAHSIFMFFRLDPGACTLTEDKLREIGGVCLPFPPGGVRSPSPPGEPITQTIGHNQRLLVFIAPNQSHVLVRLMGDLLTVDIQYYVEHQKGAFFSSNTKEYISSLEETITNLLGDVYLKSESLRTPLKRGQKVWNYATTGDERLHELDYDQLVYETNSKYQNIKILHSVEHGNVLYLDGEVMIGESDLIYTRTLCGIGKEDFKDKEILILGGGDGGILHELLKEQPRFITMAEIDLDVIKACRTHMRSVCGNSMDNLEGPHHKIVLDDCVKVMHESIKKGHQYDYVINDLTEFPVEKAVKGFDYDFETTSLISELSLNTLKPGGTLLNRGNCLSATEYRDKFEKDIFKMGAKFERSDAYVPSFQETYCFYKIWKCL